MSTCIAGNCGSLVQLRQLPLAVALLAGRSSCMNRCWNARKGVPRAVSNVTKVQILMKMSQRDSKHVEAIRVQVHSVGGVRICFAPNLIDHATPHAA